MFKQVYTQNHLILEKNYIIEETVNLVIAFLLVCFSFQIIE